MTRMRPGSHGADTASSGRDAVGVVRAPVPNVRAAAGGSRSVGKWPLAVRSTPPGRMVFAPVVRAAPGLQRQRGTHGGRAGCGFDLRPGWGRGEAAPGKPTRTRRGADDRIAVDAGAGADGAGADGPLPGGTGAGRGGHAAGAGAGGDEPGDRKSAG